MSSARRCLSPSDYKHRNLRLHYGGVWEEQPSPSKVAVFNWIGGSHVDTNMSTLKEYTIAGLSRLFTTLCPLTDSPNRSFSYYIGGIKWDINVDTDVEFVWRNIPASRDTFTHIYCQSTPVIHESQCVDDLEAPPVVNTQPTQPTDSPAKRLKSVSKKKLPVRRKILISDDEVEPDPVINLSKVPFEGVQEGQTNTNDEDADSFEALLNKKCLGEETTTTGDSQFVQVEVNDEETQEEAAFEAAFEDAFEAATAQEIQQPPAEHNSEPAAAQATQNEREEAAFEPETQEFAFEDLSQEPESQEAAVEQESQHMAAKYNFDEIVDDPNMQLNSDSEETDFDCEETDSDPDSEDEDYEGGEEQEDDEDLMSEDFIEAEEETQGDAGDDFLPNFKNFSMDTFDMTEEPPVKKTLFKFNDDLKLFVGQEWKTVEECRRYLRMYGIKKKFEIWWQKNDPDKLICRCKAKECTWRAYVRQLNDGFTMVLRGLVDTHTCENDGKNINKMANARWIATMLEEEMRLHHSSFTARDIIKLVWKKFTVKIKYWKAWNARGIALEAVHGNYEDSYMKVPELCRQIQCSNPNSVVQWQCCPESAAFQYLFVSFRVSLDGWLKGCRPIVGFDGCFLKGKYRGVCLSAIGLDANNGIFPLAVMICGKEDGASWDKFMELISPELKKHSLPLTVMSDRAKGLINAVGKYFSGCNQRFCFRHMLSNLANKWKGEHLKDLCWAAASTYRLSEFKVAIEELDKAASGAKTYLMKEEGVKTWARSHFDQTAKCDQMTNSFTESFNAFILSIRDKPICSFVTVVSFLIMKIIYDRKRMADDWDENGFLPRVQKIIDEYTEKENDYLTEPSGNGTHCVRMYTGDHWTVDLNNHSCTCGEWQVTGIPCVHAVHLLRHLRFRISNYVSPMCTVKAYKATYDTNVKPIPHDNDWDEDTSTYVLPPTLSRSAGRPKNNRMKGQLEKLEKELKNQKKCKKCGGFGHNSRSCQGGPTTNELRAGRNTRGGRGRGARGRGEGGIAVLARGRGFVSSGRGNGEVMEPIPRGIGGRASGSGSSGGRGSRGGRASSGRGARGGRASTVGGGETGPMIGEKRKLQIPLPPPTNVKQASKKRKVFIPPQP